MNQKYKATGIVLKGSSLKESDRLVTILTPEYGLIRAVAPGAKKHKSRLRGRTELFVVNDLLIVKGRSLDKIIQADTIYTYPGLSRDIGKLAGAQYLAELCLSLALSEQPQTELYALLDEHLCRLEKLERHQLVYPNLARAVFQLLAIAGIAPEVFVCSQTRQKIAPNATNPQWRVGFSFESGGIVDLTPRKSEKEPNDEILHFPKINYKLNSIELAILQLLNRSYLHSVDTELNDPEANLTLDEAWIRVERVLREYIQHHIGKPIHSASLVDNLYVEF